MATQQALNHFWQAGSGSTTRRSAESKARDARYQKAKRVVQRWCTQGPGRKFSVQRDTTVQGRMYIARAGSLNVGYRYATGSSAFEALERLGRKL